MLKIIVLTTMYVVLFYMLSIFVSHRLVCLGGFRCVRWFVRSALDFHQNIVCSMLLKTPPVRLRAVGLVMQHENVRFRTKNILSSLYEWSEAYAEPFEKKLDGLIEEYHALNDDFYEVARWIFWSGEDEIVDAAKLSMELFLLGIDAEDAAEENRL